MQYIEVTSSNVKSVAYSPEGHLHVRFHNGSEYRYLNTPKSVFDDFLTAPSAGRFLNTEVKKQFAAERL